MAKARKKTRKAAAKRPAKKAKRSDGKAEGPQGREGESEVQARQGAKARRASPVPCRP